MHRRPLALCVLALAEGQPSLPLAQTPVATQGRGSRVDQEALADEG